LNNNSFLLHANNSIEKHSIIALLLID